MKKKNSTIIFVVLGIALLIGAIYFISNKTIDQDGFLKVRMYDKDGNIIGNSNSLSVVGGIPGVSYIDLTVTVRNSGSIPLSCSIVSALPTSFQTALSSGGTKTVPITGDKKASWTSNLISVSQFEGTTTTFSATVRCSYSSGSQVIFLGDQTGGLPLVISADGTGSFSVDVGTGLPTEYCGDSVCQSNEDSTTCPADCSTVSRAKFRTSSLTYATGGAIAYSSTCGNTLTQYGYVSSGGVLTGSCASADKSYCGTSMTQAIASLPGEYYTGGTSPSLWISGDSATACLCDENGAGKYFFRKYSSSDADKTKVSSDSQATGSLEVSC